MDSHSIMLKRMMGLNASPKIAAYRSPDTEPLPALDTPQLKPSPEMDHVLSQILGASMKNDPSPMD